jgi:hypothetical protein
MNRMLVVWFVAATLGFTVEASARPTLNINRYGFCVSAPDWSISVFGAAPNSSVFLKEWQGSLGQVNTLAFAGTIGTTDGQGNFFYTTSAPNFVGHFFGQVTISGEISSPVIYATFTCSAPQTWHPSIPSEDRLLGFDTRPSAVARQKRFREWRQPGGRGDARDATHTHVRLTSATRGRGSVAE